MVYVVWPVFSWICKSLSQTDPGIQHKRFNTTYHWPIGPRLRRIILKQAGSARSQGAKGGYQWLDREDFFSKKGHFHIGWLQEVESVVQQFVAECFVCRLCFLPSLLPAPEWILNGLPWVIYTWMPGVSSSLDCRANRCFSTNSLLDWKMDCREALPMVPSLRVQICVCRLCFLLRMSFVGRRIWTKPFGSPWMLWSFRFSCVPCLHLWCILKGRTSCVLWHLGEGSKTFMVKMEVWFWHQKLSEGKVWILIIQFWRYVPCVSMCPFLVMHTSPKNSIKSNAGLDKLMPSPPKKTKRWETFFLLALLRWSFSARVPGDWSQPLCASIDWLGCSRCLLNFTRCKE